MGYCTCTLLLGLRVTFNNRLCVCMYFIIGATCDF